MSSIAGVLSRDGAKVDPTLIENMLKAVQHRGSDATQIEQGPNQPIAVGQAVWYTTPDAPNRQIKYSFNNQDYFIVLDGRLDDRDILLKQLDLANQHHKTDSELLIRSYVKWGESFLEQVEGDFAFGLWDCTQQTLILARDRSGMCNLFYYADEQRLLWGTEMKQIFQCPSIPTQINKEYLLRYLIEYPAALEDTVYAAIKRVEPGHYVRIKNNHLTIKSYYSFKPLQLSYRSEQEYIEHFQHLFLQTIKNATRAPEKIGFSLSGGLDSSSIVSATGHLIEQGAIPAKQVTCYSLVFDDFREADEREYIEAVQEKYPSFHYEMISGDQHWNFNAGTFEFISELDEPYFLFSQSFARTVPQKMQQADIRVHIGGHTGDHVLMGNADYLATLFKKLQLFTLFREFKALKKHGYLLRDLFFSHTLKPMFDQNKSSPLPTWLIEEQIKRTIAPELMNTIKPSKAIGWDEEGVTRYFKEIMYQSGHEWSNSYIDGRHAVEIRYPFLNRKLMEFLAGTPVNLKWKPNETKYILRQAMKGILPKKVERRTGKAHHDSFIYGGLLRERKKIEEYYASPLLTELKLVNGKLVQQKFDQYFVGMKPNAQDFVGLLRVLSLEIWLQKHKFVI